MFYHLNKITKSISFVCLGSLLPVYAQAQEYFGQIDVLLTNANGFINTILVPLIFTASLGMFIYGMFRYFVFGGAIDDDRKKGQTLMIWGIAGFVLMVSIWGIVNLIADGLFGSVDSTVPILPGVPTL
ncbi:MAG: hypothetical protein AUK16_01135 [Parcubacteria group bacterium CG2_30_44_11]|nr:MAG: hypothetical protein AUK16_01135 [Parcubacteria group bacterium CG2_30_44_11]